uniref:Heat shock factor binding protein 1 n=1 Tax=Odontella aurita TaxID=265563 RepID=A0A7S4I6V7_9STRA|mmetsp:Transcript_20791/g.60498  ORF Transcript_20791/g.60498 Transcript_20791/m.60498 type:complete len:136 (+) Transcript_20791:307-714(+)|eukprot:CAMPEP_0113547928 /NCGR_PEP_ID=MMETSP0015_2-20120614/12621_1 /TAXON_ID=2838 /ORGANISM="Odontella" /LENGTH=135 /DNA_ID=CAMNT_0000448523 /DNA_START=163 /DNA_END=570 /DNA_ORIENTATION=+ /assembly_acc=CAM_ASM_000160
MVADSSSSAQRPPSGGGNNGSKSLATGTMPPSSSTTDALASTSASGTGAGVPEGEDLNVFVQDLLDQMQTRFSQMGDSILGRIDAMGNQIDELEHSVKDLMDQAGVDAPPPSHGGGGGGGGGAALEGAEGRRTGA